MLIVLQVKVSRLGRSHHLQKSQEEMNTIYCTVTGIRMYPDAMRW